MSTQIDAVQMRRLEAGAKPLCLLLHVLDQLRTLNPFRPAGKVFHKRGHRELSSRLVAFDYQRLEPGAGGVDGRRQSGAP
jgi:hypothetical protein